MYLYNLLFNFDKSDGLFTSDEDPTNPALRDLKSSNVWLESSIQGMTAANVEVPANWTDLGHGSTLYLPTNPNPGDIGIRIAPDLRATSPPINLATATVQLVVSFGRPAPSSQTQASPFTQNGQPNGKVQTTFAGAAIPANTSRGWFLKFGRIAKRPGQATLAHRYQFSVGIIVVDGGKTHHYGEDPEMDVGL